MALQHALIVDDSRTAQARLKKLLGRYQLQVDTAASAEQALSYLSYQLPSVIFMDHLMEGMDGFEALRLIKSNPETATIPIIMYTSKSGDVYVSQARALGAVDVLSKDSMQSANLEQVMTAVGIQPHTGGQATTSASSTQPSASASSSASSGSGLSSSHAGSTPQSRQLPAEITAADSIRRQVAKSLEISIASIRQEVKDSQKVLSSQLLRELGEIKQQQAVIQGKLATQTTPPADDSEDIAEPTKDSYASVVVFMVLLAGLVAASLWLQYQQGQQLHQLAQQPTATAVAPEPEAKPESDDNQHRQQQALLDALAWTFNQNGTVPFYGRALEERQLNAFSGLIHYLNQARFNGNIVIELRRGDFCVNLNEQGNYDLPAPDSLQAECQLLSDYNAGSDAWLSESFNQFINSSPILQGARIDLLINDMGFTNPLYDYPAPSVNRLAQEWNDYATINNRVDIRLVKRAHSD